MAEKRNQDAIVSGNKTAMVHSRNTIRTSNDVKSVPRRMMIQVDQKNEVMLLPIHGDMVRFRVTTVKSVFSKSDANNNCYIHIIFNVSGVPTSLNNASDVFLKNLSFRSRDPRHASEVVQMIKTLRNKVVARESERAKRSTLVNQENLVLSGNKFKPIRLSQLWIRPPFGGRGRKLSGNLEAHQNGFRYSTLRLDERVDILFGNIKHAFFQPAEKEMITLIHFHLHNHIMVGNKKTKDVQFYVEVMDIVQSVGCGNRSAFDPDEIEEEQRERNRKNKINIDFKNFVNRVNNLQFDQPLRRLGFHGVPHKTSVFIVPTPNCLIELIETPFFVVSLNEIEIVNLERVGLAQKNFDMAIVFKDFKRDVVRIDSIPSSSLNGIKKWLQTADIKYYESKLNMNWVAILKTIRDDPQLFIDEGRWEFLNLEASDSDSEDSQELDQVYEPSDMKTESEDDDSESEPESDSHSDSDSDDDDDSRSESHGGHSRCSPKRPKLV